MTSEQVPSKEKVQRYYRGTDGMQPNIAGDWVTYADYERLQLELASARTAVEGWRQLRAAHEPGLHHWWCETCRRQIENVEVTHDETHDLRAGGCGQHVFARPAQPPAPEQWQPIETAPKDLTPILGYVLPPRMQPSLEGPRVVKWCGEESMWSMPGISGLSCSHWMPLPSGPTKEVR